MFRNGPAVRLTSLVILCGATATLLSNPAISQAQDEASATKPAEATALEEVIVTAQKRAESAQEIPKSVEVLSQSALTRAGVTNLQDLNLISPSIQGTVNSGSPPAIRGISS